MAIKGLKPTSIKTYVLKDDPCREPPIKDETGKIIEYGKPLPGATVFHIKTLDGYERAVVRDYAINIGTEKNEKGEDVVKMVDKPGLFKPSYQTLRIALQGWDNFLDDDGNPIPFETESTTLAEGMPSFRAPTWACLVRLPPAEAFELMWEVMGFNELTKAEASKSGAVSSPVKSIPSESVAPATPSADDFGAAALDLLSDRSMGLPERRIPRHDRDILDREPGVRRTLMGGGASGSIPPQSLSSGKGN